MNVAEIKDVKDKKIESDLKPPVVVEKSKQDEKIEEKKHQEEKRKSDKKLDSNNKNGKQIPSNNSIRKHSLTISVPETHLEDVKKENSDETSCLTWFDPRNQVPSIISEGVVFPLVANRENVDLMIKKASKTKTSNVVSVIGETHSGKSTIIAKLMEIIGKPMYVIIINLML